MSSKNPVLTYLVSPTPKSISPRGKSEKDIVYSRLQAQRKELSAFFAKANEEKSSISSHNGKTHFIARMYPDSNSATKTPTDLFKESAGCKIVSAAFNGFLVEADISKLHKMSDRILTSETINSKVDISRVKQISLFDIKETLRGRTASEVWKVAETEGSKEFIFWLMPFTDKASRLSVVNDIKKYQAQGSLYLNNTFHSESGESESSIDRSLEKYLLTGRGTFLAHIKDASSLELVASSGTSYRINPAINIFSNAVPGNGREPIPPIGNIEQLPSVVIIDGGLSAISYKPMELFCAPPLIQDTDADLPHGNQVTSLVCNGHAWNNNLKLPSLNCRFITAQAITKKGATKQPTRHDFISYLRYIAEKTKGQSKVWNLSFNESLPSPDIGEVSHLGHEISSLAREFDILPIISIGNVSKINNDLCPPADCEAGLTVSGRSMLSTGLPGAFCKDSLTGPGPSGMFKPDLSWFSQLRTIGGGISSGTSFSAPLVSSLAAHTFNNLKNPTPDLVRALLIDAADQSLHCSELGWGTPWEPNSLPWACSEGAVTLAWVSKIEAGQQYYWNDIYIPDELFKDGKLSGKISLTAILKPLTSDFAGTNYFSSRIEVALQSKNKKGEYPSLLGAMRERGKGKSKNRTELAKWNPVRRHSKKFKATSIDRNNVRLYARAFVRDMYLTPINGELPPKKPEHEIAFVLTFQSQDKNTSIYDSTKNKLSFKVEAAVTQQAIEINV